MANSTRILWGRILLGGLIAEAVLIGIAIPLSRAGQQPVIYEALVGSFVMPFVLALWVGRRLASRFVLHGVLIGAAATLIYLALGEAGRRWGPPSDPQPFAYTVAHGLKLVGGALGGMVARRRAARAPGHSTATAV
jgi:hypothetical protein